MVTKHERHISYICPACNSVTTRLIDPFAFSGRKSITVTCSKKDCEITCVHIHDHEGTYVIEAFCTLCGSIHSTTISKRHFWNNPLTSLTCDVSGIDMLFIGESDTIKAAWEVFEQKCREFEEDDYGFIEWLFKENINFNVANFKEDTSLQRKVKKALLNGIKIGCAYGILK